MHAADHRSRGGMPRLAVCLLVALLLLPPVAQAQPGVFVDPESPAGKEYAIPLRDARSQGADEEPRDRGNGRAGVPELFGEGIEQASSAAAEGGGNSGASSGDPRDNSRGNGEGEVLGARAGSRSEAGEGSPRGGSSVAVEAAATGGSEALVTAGIAGLVLAGGLAVGFGLRRFLRSE